MSTEELSAADQEGEMIGHCDEGVLIARGLCKTFKQRSWLWRYSDAATYALQNVSVTLEVEKTLGIVGESGAGKSTLARCLAGFDSPDAGEIRLDGQNLLQLNASAFRRARRQIQLIFQGAAASLNPRFSAVDIVTEPATIAGRMTKRDRHELGLSLMESVGLPRSAALRRPADFSGGERQRLAIARALSLAPKVLVFDESLSGLDLTVQAQLVNLLLDLQASRSMSYVFISHDLRLAAWLADKLAVMHGGRIVEYGPSDHVSTCPQHPHTQALLSAVVRLDSVR